MRHLASSRRVFLALVDKARSLELENRRIESRDNEQSELADLEHLLAGGR